jgi:hypothetical protein
VLVLGVDVLPTSNKLPMIGHGHGPNGMSWKNIVCKVTTKNIRNIDTIKGPHFLSIFLGAQTNESLTCPCCLCQNLATFYKMYFGIVLRKNTKYTSMIEDFKPRD